MRWRAPGSFVGIEEAAPMPDEAFEAKRAEALSSGEENAFFTLVYNQQHAPRGSVVRGAGLGRLADTPAPAAGRRGPARAGA